MLRLSNLGFPNRLGRTICKPAQTAINGVYGNGRIKHQTAKRAEAVIQVAELPNPPLRLLLGKYAYAAATAKLGDMLNDVENWKENNDEFRFKGIGREIMSGISGKVVAITGASSGIGEVAAGLLFPAIDA